MIKFCRSCGKALSEPTQKTCPSCNTNAVKATNFCRYCGHPTNVEDATCLHCGASIRPLPSSVRSLFEHPRLSTKMGKVINLSIISVMVATYVVFSLPKSITKPVAQAATDVVMANTGYTALPLDTIEISPPVIPEYYTYYFYAPPTGIAVNSTRQLTVYAIYRNSNTENATKVVHLVDVTNNCTYTSSNPNFVTCDPSGLIHAIAPGNANIIASYTAPPGTANISNAAEGKIMATFTATVNVNVAGANNPIRP